MYHQADPTDFRFVYGAAQNGVLVRLDPLTGDHLDIRPQPAEGEPDYRFDWVTPVLVSVHDPRVIYLGGNRLFISRDRGISWERTVDLTRRIDRDAPSLMGVKGSEAMLSKNDGTSSFGEITTIAESPLDPNVLWVGTDDGNVQLSRDGGRSWTEVGRNVRGVRSGTYVSRVEASTTRPGVAYAAFDGHRDGDFAPYLFRTENFGRSWAALTAGLPAEGSVNVVREHRGNPNLLFLGTEHALFVSTDAGRNWARLGANLPTTLYDDLVIHPRDDDLIVGTHGRSLWILDDLAPLVGWSAQVASADAHLFPVRSAAIVQYWKDTSYRGQGAYSGENPPEGAILSYYLRRPAPEARISVSNEQGVVVRRLPVDGSAGVIHRVEWNLRHAPPPFAPDTDRVEALPVLPHPITPRGPHVSPGRYTLSLEAGRARATQTLVVTGDPLLALSGADWREREVFLLDVLELQRRVWDAAQRADELSRAAVAERDSAGADVSENLMIRADSANALARRLRNVRRDVYRLAGVFNGAGVRQGSLYPPTETHRVRLRDLKARLEAELVALARVEQRMSEER